MKQEQLKRMKEDKGFIAALDQSGGSTPKALAAYGVPETAYSNEEEMFDRVHAMRTRIIKSPAFNPEKILGAILFEQTMDRRIDDKFTADFLWENKKILPFLKVDQGLAARENGVCLMKPIQGLEALLDRAVERNIFGTKMRSVIYEYNEEGIRAVVKQQFEVAAQIAARGLVPIIEPEVDIHSPEKEKCEDLLKAELLKGLETWPVDRPIMFKVTIPTQEDLYVDLMQKEAVVRVVALSGGYSRELANELLAKNHGLIASFSRALAEGLSAAQSDEEFDRVMSTSIQGIFEASIT